SLSTFACLIRWASLPRMSMGASMIRRQAGRAGPLDDVGHAHGVPWRGRHQRAAQGVQGADPSRSARALTAILAKGGRVRPLSCPSPASTSLSRGNLSLFLAMAGYHAPAEPPSLPVLPARALTAPAHALATPVIAFHEQSGRTRRRS